MFCTPPGVTGLTTCQPIDPCEGETTDITCVTYSGQDFSCIDVSNGDDLISVLLNILATYFPPEICCQLEGTLTSYTTTTSTTTTSTTTTSTTSTTTTTTSTTTTTTTVAPATCDCFIILNNTFKTLSYSYVDCQTKFLEPGRVPGKSSETDPPVAVYQCAMSGSVYVETGLTYTNLGLCTSECVAPTTTTTTTSTTTAAPSYSNFYEAEIYTCTPLNCSEPAGTTVITVQDPLTLSVGSFYLSANPLDTNTYRVIGGTVGPTADIVFGLALPSCTFACEYLLNPPPA